MTSPPVLQIRDVHKRYGDTEVLAGVSFSVASGEVVGLLGPNGAGKTTLIRMMLDLIRPDQGEVLVLGQAPSPALKSRIGYLPEERGLYPKQRVERILSYLVSLAGVDRKTALHRARQWLIRVDLRGYAHKRVRELSKGMQQKVQMGAALLHEPELLVLDEPFTGLDPVNRRLVSDVIAEARSRGAAVVVSSHLIDQVEQLCDSVVLIRRGRVLLSGSVQEVKERHAGGEIRLQASAGWRDDPALASLVASVTREERGFDQVTLAEGSSADALLKALVAGGHRVDHFSRSLPSLEEVFVRCVVEADEAADRDTVRAEFEGEA